jgi:chromosome segregation ATPase
MEILFLIVGIALGSASAWFIAKSKFSSQTSGISIEEFNNLDKEKERIKAQLDLISAEKEKTSLELETKRNELMEAQKRLGNAEEVFKSQKEKIATLEAHYKEKMETLQ